MGRPPLVVSVAIPEYTVDRRPDYLAIGAKLDEVLCGNFVGQSVVVRGVGLADHPGLTLDQLVAKVLAHGTDRYDPERTGVCHEEFLPYRPDMHGLPCTVSGSGLASDHYPGCPSVMAEVIRDFFEGAVQDRGRSVRLDLLLVYDRSLLTLARRQDAAGPRVAPRLESLLFRFRDGARKRRALLGVVRILVKE